jgi:hypothetical protein
MLKKSREGVFLQDILMFIIHPNCFCYKSGQFSYDFFKVGHKIYDFFVNKRIRIFFVL